MLLLQLRRRGASYICITSLLHALRPHTTTYVRALLTLAYTCADSAIAPVSRFRRILVYMCHDTSIFVSAFHCTRVRILECTRPTQVSGFMEPTAVQAEAIDAVVCQGRDALVLPSSYFFFPSMDVGTYILVSMCPHTTIYVSSYHYVCGACRVCWY